MPKAIEADIDTSTGTTPTPTATSTAGTIEGGEYHCYIHDLVTSDTEEWYSHMESKDEDKKPLHMEDGTSDCIFCHAPNTPFNNPWTRPGTTKGAVCDGCKQTQLGGSTN